MIHTKWSADALSSSSHFDDLTTEENAENQIEIKIG